ncbi:MAG TPA: hypothetical protein VMW27_05590 [Thermoanaerobaculia bacterium]|nr:hypothetical protein [Thermoanaerobaculia bacterium]
MTSGHLQIRTTHQRLCSYEIERAQFSLAGDWQGKCRSLEVRSLYYFGGNAPHEVATPPEQRGPLFTFVRTLEDVADGPGALRSLELVSAKFAAAGIPFPAGISFGTSHLGIREMTYSLAWLGDLRFQCRAEGRLECIGEDSRDLHEATFKLEAQLAFDGVWLESADPQDTVNIEQFYDSRFGDLGLTKELDCFADAVVLRAYP